jgi:hypothetical protein
MDKIKPTVVRAAHEEKTGITTPYTGAIFKSSTFRVNNSSYAINDNGKQKIITIDKEELEVQSQMRLS